MTVSYSVTDKQKKIRSDCLLLVHVWSNCYVQAHWTVLNFWGSTDELLGRHHVFWTRSPDHGELRLGSCQFSRDLACFSRWRGPYCAS